MAQAISDCPERSSRIVTCFSDEADRRVALNALLVCWTSTLSSSLVLYSAIDQSLVTIYKFGILSIEYTQLAKKSQEHYFLAPE
jgi:hypothetical protein